MAPKAKAAETRAPICVQIAGNRLELIESGKARLQLLLRLIDEATSSVRLLIYMYNADRAGDRVRDALVRAAERGVAVKVLVDGFGSSVPAGYFDPIASAGGHHCVFNPSYGRRYFVRDHQKLIVIDEKIALVGGANLDETYLSDKGPEHWRDLWLRIDGPEAGPPARYFDSLFRWSRRRNARLRSLRSIVAEYTEWHGPIQWKFSGPLSVRNSWWRTIGRDIRHGHDLEMIFAYFAPPGAMLRRIGRLGRRGRARIITAAKSDNGATISAARHSYSRLLRRHVQMFEYQPAKLHTKLVIIDDVVHIGSSNFDYRSLYINLEVMVRVRDKEFASKLRDYFEGEIERSKWITPDFHKRRSNPWLRFKWALSHFLVNVMDYTVTRRLNFSPER